MDTRVRYTLEPWAPPPPPGKVKVATAGQLYGSLIDFPTTYASNTQPYCNSILVAVTTDLLTC